MINVNGLHKFKQFFENYDTNYIVIGGTACQVIFDEIGLTFRSTKDIDIVLISENLNELFAKTLWDFIKEANYEIEYAMDKKCFYRFKNPKNAEYPKMIELFSRKQTSKLLEDVHIIPIHIADEISSLSAILLNDDYYQFLMKGKRIINGISVLDERYIIPFKVKAWCELVERRLKGEQGQLKHIKKHCRDIFLILKILPDEEKIELSGMVKQDMRYFVESIITSEYVPADINCIYLSERLKFIYLDEM